jgi:hypothetical protein
LHFLFPLFLIFVAVPFADKIVNSCRNCLIGYSGLLNIWILVQNYIFQYLHFIQIFSKTKILKLMIIIWFRRSFTCWRIFAFLSKEKLEDQCNIFPIIHESFYIWDSLRIDLTFELKTNWFEKRLFCHWLKGSPMIQTRTGLGVTIRFWFACARLDKRLWGKELER